MHPRARTGRDCAMRHTEKNGKGAQEAKRPASRAIKAVKVCSVLTQNRKLKANIKYLMQE